MNSRHAIWISVALVAQLGAVEPEPIPAGEGKIDSVSFSFEKREGLIRHSGNVQLTIPGALNLTCEDLLAQRDASGKFSTIVATTNVVIQLLQVNDSPLFKAGSTNGSPVDTATAAVGSMVRPLETNWAYCFKAVFIGTNNTVVLTGSPETGSPRVMTATAAISAEELTYNRTTGKFTGSGKSQSRFKVGQFNLNPKRDGSTNSP
jgi:hypothetical protein